MTDGAAVIFDIAGVLTDPEWFIAEAGRKSALATSTDYIKEQLGSM